MRRLTICSMLAIAATVSCLPSAASAATLCVSPGGAHGCYAHIAEAVAAAAANDTIDVQSGVYAEGVEITKPLSLSGDGATINAAGQKRGIFVNGLLTDGLAGVHITGLTVENANFEGILVANASAVTIGNNTILNNNRALVTGTCPGIEAFEPGEQQDCGEGIHLLGAHHAIVTNNVVEKNSGGILISDDTGEAHDNLVSFNTVIDNPYACGINMASHVPAPSTGSLVPFGVFHNTIYGNHSMNNGSLNGGGAGIGIFASVPFAKSYGNVVVANYVNSNGHPGISMHAHAPHQILNDNVLVGNLVVGNGADTADAHTPGPTGINLYSVVPVTGNIISGNVIAEETIDVAVKAPALVQVEFNDLLGPDTGLDNLGTGPVDASSNWWGVCGDAAIGGCSVPAGPDVTAGPKLATPIIPLPVF